MGKTMIRAILLLCLYSTAAYGQLVHFSDTTGQWHVVGTYPHGAPEDPGFIESSTTGYQYEGDTVINGMIWSKMVAWPFIGAGGVAEHIGFAREMGDLVLFMDTLYALDTIYDFSIQPGDSIYYSGSISAYLHVSQVDSFLIAGIYHRVFDFEPFLDNPPDILNERWIEGIGSIHGPLFPRYPRTFMTEVPADSLILSCYSRSDSMVWHHPDFPECVVNIILGIENPYPNKSLIMAWPNPGNALVRFGCATDRLHARVFNAMGMLVLENPSMDPKVGLNMSNLGPGIYMITISTDYQGSQSVRWIKQ